MGPGSRPFRVRRSDLPGLLAACALVADDRDPLPAILDAPPAAPAAAPGRQQGAGESVIPGADPPALLRDALAVLCAPRSHLRVEDGTRPERIALDLYLAGGCAVGFREDADGSLLVSAPQSIDVVGEQLADLITGSPAAAGTSHAVGDKVLLALDCCVARGLGAESGVAPSELVTVLHEAGLDEAVAAAVLDALLADRLLAESGDGLVMGPACAAWSQAFPLGARLELTATDAAPSGRAPRSLLFAGVYGERILAADDVEAEEPGTLFRALTTGEARAAVGVLLDGEPPAANRPRETGRMSPGSDAREGPSEPELEAVSGAELFALYDATFPEVEDSDAGEPAGKEAELQAELRSALVVGRRLLAERGLVTREGVPAPSVAELMRAWQDPALVVSIERTDIRRGTVESRCSRRGDLLVVEERNGDALAVYVLSAAALASVVTRLTGLDVPRRAGREPIDWRIEPTSAETEQPGQLEELVRVSAQYVDGDLVRGGETQFAYGASAECWEIVEAVEPAEDGSPAGAVLRLVPIDSGSLLDSILAWLPAAESPSASAHPEAVNTTA